MDIRIPHFRGMELTQTVVNLAVELSYVILDWLGLPPDSSAFDEAALNEFSLG